MSNNQKFIYGIIGFCVGNIMLVLLFLGFSALSSSPKHRMSFEDALARIQNKEIRSVVVKNDFVELTDLSNVSFLTPELSETQHQELVKTVANVNVTKFSEEIGNMSFNPVRIGFFFCLICLPIIIVLLLIIIKKMNSKNSMN
jgi:ATP-dependent Zn protease